MSERRARGGSGRTRLVWAAVAALVISVIVLIGPGSTDGEPLDPASTGADGTKGLVDTLEELGVPVSVWTGAPGPDVFNADTHAALLLEDNLSDDQRQDISLWMESGGLLVVGDASSPLSPGSAFRDGGTGELVPSDAASLERACSVPALSRVNTVVSPGAAFLSVPSGAIGCFPNPSSSGDAGRPESEAWMVLMPRGRGWLVALGGAGAFTNSVLDRADNALLAVDLLAPQRGDGVAVLWTSPTGSGRKGLVELVPAAVKLGLLQLGVAFLVVVLWRARRLGRPVIEYQPVAVEGSESVAAVGRLLQRARGRSQAATILRDDLRRTLTTRLGLPADAPLAHVADAASIRSGVPVQRVLEVLGGEDPRGEEELVALARSVESLRTEVAHGP